MPPSPLATDAAHAPDDVATPDVDRVGVDQGGVDQGGVDQGGVDPIGAAVDDAVEEAGARGYEVAVEGFSGPFDLLLQLIARRQMDVASVDLAEITGDFLAQVASLDELDLETATHFLVVAATLVEIKAARLLPREERDELDDVLSEARDLLYARLLEYRAFRALSTWTGERLAANAGTHPRQAPMEPAYTRLVPRTTLDVTAVDLARLAGVALRPRPEPRVTLDHIRRSYITIRDAARTLIDALPADGAGSYRAVVRGRSRGDRIVFFLAVLELCKLGHLDVEQPTYHDDLTLRRREGGRDLDSLTEDGLEGGVDADAIADRLGDVANTVEVDVAPLPDEAPPDEAQPDEALPDETPPDETPPDDVHAELVATDAAVDLAHSTGAP